jgi:hypothetical protein
LQNNIQAIGRPAQCELNPVQFPYAAPSPDSRMSRTRARRPPTPTPSRADPSNWPKIVGVVLAALCLLGLFGAPISDTDFWWHLRTGQFIAERHSLPVPDPFSYTATAASEAPVRHFNLTHEWLSQLLMYAVYVVGGFPAIVLSRAVLLAAICLVTGFLAFRLSANFILGVAAAFAAASVLVSFTADRPGVVSFLGVAVFVCVLELRRGIWALPALALLWANCHGGFFLGWLVLLAYLADSLLARERGRLWLVALSAIAASGINPNGFRVLLTILQYRRSPMTANLVEWQPTSLWGPPYAFDILLYAAALVLILSWRRVRPAHWILFVAFAAASLTAFRNTALIGFLAPVLIAAYFPQIVRLPRIPEWVPIVVLVGAAIAVIVGGGLGRTVDEWTIPEGAANYVLEHHLSGPMFNTYEQGGYLIWRLWPQERVFIDGRSLSERVYRDYQTILFNRGLPADQIVGPRAELLDRYNVQVVVMNTLDFVSGALYPLALALANPNTADWSLVYDDSQAVVFVRRPPPELTPLSNKLGRVLRHLDRECEEYIQNSPSTPRCAGTLADYWLKNEAWDPARRMLVLYLAHTQRRDERAERALRDLDAAHH